MWKGGVVWGLFLYNDNTTALFARFGGMLPQKNFEKIVSFGAFLFICVLNNF